MPVNPSRRVIHKLRSAFPTEWRGEHSGVEAAGQFVGRDQKEWKQLWDAAHSNMYPIPKAPKLPKDKIAVAIFTGQTNEAVTIRVIGVQPEPRRTVVEFEAASRPILSLSAPNTVATVQREPFLLKFIDRTDNKIEFRQLPATARPGPGITPRQPPF